jgi:IS4 transposase
MCDVSCVSAAQQSAVQTQIQVSVMLKQQQATKQQGAAAVELIQSAAQMSKSLDTGKVFDAVG